MRNQIAPAVARWPFFVADGLLLCLAIFICFQSKHPLGTGEVLACVACVSLGAFFGAWPFLLNYRALTRIAEAYALASVVGQIKKVDKLAEQISGATGQWQSVQESADKTAKQAREIAQSMAKEAKSFEDFLKNANDSERATLRLEVDKLRRAEIEWLQTVVRMLDHIFALHRAAVRSGQPSVIEQLGNFQNACRDVARRVGLVPFIAAPADAFDEARHQVVEGSSKPAAGAAVEETVAAGYTFQGKLIRPAMVRLRNGEDEGVQAN